MKYYEEAQPKGNDECHEPCEKLCKVEANLTEHGYISGKPWMASYKQDSFHPAQQDDDTRNMLDGHWFRHNKHQDKSQDNKGNLYQIFNTENVSSVRLCLRGL